MSRLAGFVADNIRTIGMIYVIGAIVVFIGVLLFFWWVCRLEEKERELCRYEDEASGRATAVVAVLIAIPCALMWCMIPIIIFAVWIFYEFAERFPMLMGHMQDDVDNGETEVLK